MKTGAYEREEQRMKYITNNYGRRVECHFYSQKGSKVSCKALKEFYNIRNDIEDQCAGCPFYKTSSEFFAAGGHDPRLDIYADII